jgi:hypothetical protein
MSGYREQTPAIRWCLQRIESIVPGPLWRDILFDSHVCLIKGKGLYVRLQASGMLYSCLWSAHCVVLVTLSYKLSPV